MRNIMNTISRNDGAQRVFLSEGILNVVEILQENYPEIYESIQKEGFILKYGQCNLFKELLFENNVVGFCSYDFSREFMTLALNNIYVLPQYRGNSFLLNELASTMAEQNKPSIMEPTRLIVELLIEYGFASKITDNIVASAIEFVVPADHVLSNMEYGLEELSTHFYDLDICASIHILDVERSHVAYSAPLNYDIIYYDCLDYRHRISDEYFEEISKTFRDRDVDIMNVILDLEENLPIKTYTLDEIIGPEGEFSFYIQSMIDDAHVTQQKALEIKNQIREEYEAGMLLNESLLVRLAYLFDESHKERITLHDDVCPYCGMPIDSHDRFCHFCGINLDYDIDEMENSLLTSIDDNESDFKEDIRFIAYKFLKLIEERIDMDYAIFTIENTYNINWSEMKEFLDINGYFSQDHITPEGFGFLKSHPLHFWNKYHMEIIDYTDFENYFYIHEDLTPKEICLNYLNKFEKEEYILDIINEIKKDCSTF